MFSCCYPTVHITLPSKCLDFLQNSNKESITCILAVPYIILFICFCFYSYDEEADKVNQYQRLNLEGLEKIEIGECF